MKIFQFFIVTVLYLLSAQNVNALSCSGHLPEIFLQCANGICTEAFLVDYEHLGNRCEVIKNIVPLDPQIITASKTEAETTLLEFTKVNFPEFTNGIYKIMLTKACLKDPKLIWDYFDTCSRQTTIEEYSSATDSSAFQTLKVEHENEAKEIRRKYYTTLSISVSVWLGIIGLLALFPTLYVRFKKKRGTEVKNSNYIIMNIVSLISLLILLVISFEMLPTAIIIIFVLVFWLLVLITLIQITTCLYKKFKK